MYARSLILKAYVCLVLAVVIAPLLVVVGVSFNPTSRFAISLAAVSLRWYHEFFTRPEYVHALFSVSLPLAITASALATIVGTLTAIALVRFNISGRDFLESAFMLPILIPSILLGAALYLFFVRLDAAGSFGTLVVGHMLIGIPFVTRVVAAGLAGINPAIEEAAISLGCSRIAAFRKVVIPLLRSSLWSGAIFAFILSFSDINVALFLAGPNTNTLPLHIFSDIQWEGDPTIAAASTIQMVVVTSLILLAQRFSRARLVF
jgi:ABC-type spermidine/putrescine transport system permease subunit II